MITIFGDFSQKPMIKIFALFGFVSSQKRHFFTEFFGENIVKIITSVPGSNPTILNYNASAVNTYQRHE
jgi:hypothetical protein